MILKTNRLYKSVYHNIFYVRLTEEEKEKVKKIKKDLIINDTLRCKSKKYINPLLLENLSIDLYFDKEFYIEIPPTYIKKN